MVTDPALHARSALLTGPASAGTVVVAGPLPPPVHGAGRVTEAVLDGLRARADERGPRIAVASTAGDVAGGRVRYHVSRLAAHTRALALVIRARRVGPVVLYVGGAGGGGLWYQFVLVAAARALRSRVVFHHHSWSYLDRARPAMRSIVAMMGRRDVHVCLSPSMSSGFATVYRPAGEVATVSNARFVPCTAPDAGPTPTPTPTPGRLRLVHVSNLSIEKGTARVVESFEVLRGRGVDVSLDLVGAADDNVSALVETARRRHPDVFRHHGRGSHDDVVRVLDAADLFVFPSSYRHEAQPLVVLEALGRGVPVLATRRGALADLLPASWLLEERDDVLGPDGLVERIEAFVGLDPEAGRVEARAAFARSRDTGTDLVGLLGRAIDPSCP